jgi:glycosyltransferase involved in cell wall biosynthesis
LPPVPSPAVSILMPVRNEERFLPAALASLAAQTVREWELIVVDDGSTDGTAAILAAAAVDPRVRVLRNRAKGLVSALNQGLAACRAPLVARMDGDDISHPQRLAKQLAIMAAKPEIGLVAASFRHFPRGDLKIGMLAYEQWQNALVSHDLIMADLFVEAPFVHPGITCRKEILTALDGYRDMGWAEDYDLWLRMAQMGVRFGRSEETLFFWRDRPERATRTMAEYSADAFRRCKLHHLRNGFLRGADEVILAGAGKEGRAWQRLLAAAGIGVALWVDVDPKKSGRLLHGARVVAPQELAPGAGRMLVTVGTRGARAGIRQWAERTGFRELTDFVCVT